LTFDLAFQLQEQLQAIESGGNPPDGFRREPLRALAIWRCYAGLLRQWAIPPARQFSRLPSRGRIIVSAGFMNAWHGSRWMIVA